MTRTDQFRVTIQFDDKQTSLVALWLYRFNQNVTYMWSAPKIIGGTLSIHPADFPNLLLQAQPQDCTELEFYRIRKHGALAISETLKNQKSKLSCELNNMVTGSIAGLRPTEFAEETSLEIRLPDNI